LSVASGNPSPPRITLLVDRTTRGPAEVLALALSSHGRAVLKGSAMGGDLGVRQTVQLPDGTGYTLETSDYQAISSKPALMAEATRSR
jgi:C-terminal processing protease CtpA/Prc